MVVGAQPLVIALQNIIYDGAGHAAAKKLGELGDNKAIEPLLQALNHNCSEVRVNAINALAKLGDLRVVDRIIHCLQDSDFFVRVAVASALGQLKDIKAVEPLIEALKVEQQSTACGAIPNRSCQITTSCTVIRCPAIRGLPPHTPCVTSICSEITGTISFTK